MGLNLSNEQIAQELDLDKDDVYQMTSLLRTGIVAGKPEVKLSGEVECDEVYVTAGHKGNSARRKKKGRQGRRNRLKGVRGRKYPGKKRKPSYISVECRYPKVNANRASAFYRVSAYGRGTLEKEKPPIFGMIQRGGEVMLSMLANVQQTTIEPLIKATIAPGSLVYTDSSSHLQSPAGVGLQAQNRVSLCWGVCT